MRCSGNRSAPLAAEPLLGLEPRRMAGAVVVAEAGDRLGEQLDPAARRAELARRRGRRGSGRTACGRRSSAAAGASPVSQNVVERRHRRRRARRRVLAELVVDVLEPVARGASLGELVPRARRFGELGERLVVVAGLADGVERTRHRDDVAVVAAARRCRRARASWSSGSTMSAWRAIAVQNGSCTMTVSGRAERAPQPVEVLVVVERVAAGPVHEADVGQRQRLAVVVERAARVLEQRR